MKLSVRPGGDVCRIYGSANDAALLRYGKALTACRTAILERTQRAADLGQDPAGAVESLEMLRAQLHTEIDHMIDTAELEYPSLHRLIFRAPPYGGST